MNRLKNSKCGRKYKGNKQRILSRRDLEGKNLMEILSPVEHEFKKYTGLRTEQYMK